MDPTFDLDGTSSLPLQMLTSLLMYPGDSILVEEFTYPHMLECVLLAKGAVPLPVPLDAHGMVPAGLRQVGVWSAVCWRLLHIMGLRWARAGALLGAAARLHPPAGCSSSLAYEHGRAGPIRLF